MDALNFSTIKLHDVRKLASFLFVGLWNLMFMS